MGYEVVSRFYDRDRDRYVDPGQPCPALSEETAARLVRAGCLVAAPAARKPKRGRKDAGAGDPPDDPPGTSLSSASAPSAPLRRHGFTTGPK